MKEGEYDKCDKCKANPLWWVVEYYGTRKEDEELRKELLNTDHDCRYPDPCNTCYKIQNATHEELVKMKGELV